MNLKINPRQILALLKATFQEWSGDNCLRLSAALAYYSVFSIAPLIVIAIGIAGWWLGSSANAQDGLRQQLAAQMGPQAAEGVMGMVKGAAKPSSGIMATVIGFVALLFGATGVFGQLKDALNTIWGVKAKAKNAVVGLLRERLLSFGMVLVIGFLLMVSLMLSTMLTAFNEKLSQALPMPGFVWGVIGFFLSFGVVTVLFALIFKLLPDVKMEWRTVWMGAGVTALLFELGKWGLSLYLGENTASSYGAAGSIVLVLLWVYYASLILFFGAEFTQVYAKSLGHEIQPSANAERVTPHERARQGMEPHTGAETPVFAAAKIPAEPSPLAENAIPFAQPAKETLVPLMEVEPPPVVPAAVVWEAPRGPVREKVSDWVETANRHPFAEVGAALGFGLLVGLISRVLERPNAPELSAKDHFRLGAEATAAAGATALAGLGPWLKRRMKSGAKKARSAAVIAQKRIDDLSDELPRQIKHALR
jgi:membrane protein